MSQNVIVQNDRHSEAQELTKYYMLWSLGAGALPIPLADLAAIAGVQIQMVRKLAKLYDIEFSESRTKTIVSSLAGSFTAGMFSSMAKFIPGIGHAIGMVSLPLCAGATTYALARVFIMHFETGGTLLDFDVDKMRDHFSTEFTEGKKVAATAKSSTK